MAVNFNKLHLSNDPAAFDAAIATIKKRGETLQLDIHRYLVAVCAVWQQSGDVRPAVKRVNDLLAAMPGGVRANAIRAWVEAKMGMVWSDAVGDAPAGFSAPADKQARSGKALDLDALKNVRWWEFKPEAPYKPLDLAAKLATLVKIAETRAGKATPEDNIDGELLSSLKSALGAAKARAEVDH